MNLNLIISGGINGILKTAGRFYLNNEKGRRFLSDIVPQMKRNAKKREENESKGIHIPPFLIASIATQCNLHCAGCYARANGACGESKSEEELSGNDWDRIFTEAADMGISFIMLAGGEPLIRRDVINAASEHRNTIFPIFTNSTMIDDDHLSLFENSRNLIPVLSIEGGKEETVQRRGIDTYTKLEDIMRKFKEKNILYGVSITVTKNNIHTVCSKVFLRSLRDMGCGIVFFVEYVPVEKDTDYLALDNDDLQKLNLEIPSYKKCFQDMVVLSFPGDEAAMGGCLASGRGFFHINPNGGAEPCPFSPYSKHNLKSASIRDVLCSEYFNNIRRIAAQSPTHSGGCVLFEREAEVQAMLSHLNKV